jgi:hypothetical protein
LSFLVHNNSIKQVSTHLLSIHPSQRNSYSHSSIKQNFFFFVFFLASQQPFHEVETRIYCLFFLPLTIHGSKIPNLLLTLSASPSSLPRYKPSSFQAQKNANPQYPRTQLLDKREELWCEREGGIALSASNCVSG